MAAGILAIGSQLLDMNRATPKLNIELTVPVESKMSLCGLPLVAKVVPVQALTLAPKHLGSWQSCV